MLANDQKPPSLEPQPLPAPLLASLRKAHGRTPLLRALMHAVPVDENSPALQALGLLHTWPNYPAPPKGGGETIAIGRTQLGRLVVRVADYLDRNDATALAPTITPKQTHAVGVGIVTVKVGVVTLLVGSAIDDAAVCVVPPKSLAREDVQDAKAQILCGPCSLEVAVAKAVAFAKTGKV